jgi:natural product precursor
MKKRVKKLELSKETLADLTRRELGKVEGGGSTPRNSCGCEGETSNGPFACFTCIC